MHALRTECSAVLLFFGCCRLAVAGLADPPALPWGGDPPVKPALERAAAISDLGRAIFFDRGMSASGSMSCATCHDPQSHFGPPNALSVQPGGSKLDQKGRRATPSLTYAAATPFFTEHFYESDDDGNEAIDQGPTGGRTWDGRVDRARDQVRIPLLSPLEMANPDEASVVAHVSRGPYAAQLKKLYGEQIFADTMRAFAALGEALEAFQQTPELFSPFNSKYDAFLRGEVKLTAQEERGLVAYMDPRRGNCVRCHKNQMTPSGKFPLFTDSGYVAIGVPRNMEIPANRDPRYFDLGACGPERRDLLARSEFCGLFKAPSLRNVATRKAFYHNGVFHSLEQAVAFYATRDTNPERWYPLGADGKAQKFNDLPGQYRGNIDAEPPFDKKQGEQPAMSAQDITDIVAYLGTLTDGYVAPSRAAAASCRPYSCTRRNAAASSRAAAVVSALQ
jgi:cytochrome c peroxidase